MQGLANNILDALDLEIQLKIWTVKVKQVVFMFLKVN